MLKINWLERKNPDWIKAQVINESGATINDVSISRVSKKGEAFPNFDNLVPGQDVNGVLWQSQAGAWYLFPPRPQTSAGGAYKSSGAMSKVMEKKAENISVAMDKKELAIKIASTMRMAVDCAIANLGNKQFQPIEMENLITYYRKWLWERWDANDGDFSPFPSSPKVDSDVPPDEAFNNY